MRRLLPPLTLVLLVAAAPGASAPALRLVLPYDVELDAAGRIHVADGLAHRIFRWDARAKRLVVVAGTGTAGASGDGGRATRARLDEIAGLAFDRAGNLYVADVHRGRVRRIDRRGTITTVARIRAAASVSVDPSSRYLAIASIEDGVFRLELATQKLEKIAGEGTPLAAEGPHGVAYDRTGALFVSGGDVRRIDPDGRMEVVARAGFKVVPTAGGTLYALTGDPNGGRVSRIEPDGTLTPVVGTGSLSRQRDGVAALSVGILPTDVALARDGSLLVTQAQPVAALRRVDLRTGRITTLVR
jgi:sugar lactone lactonase YvrE